MEASVLGQPYQPYPVASLGARASLLRIHGDEWLIAQMRRGNEAAFEALVERYRPRLLSFCRHMLRSREDGEDVLQEVFSNAYRAILADEREINVRPWLYRIARNMCLKHLARRRIKADSNLDDLDVAGTSGTVDAVQMREDLRQVVADVRELPESQRTALLLREIEGLSYDQIAEAMDTTVASVKSLLVRARVSLAETAEGRVLACDAVEVELRAASEGAARVSSPVRRHMRQCDACALFNSTLAPARRPAAAALLLGPLGLMRDIVGKLGIGAVASGGTAAGGASIAGGAAGGCAGGAMSGGLTLIAGKAAVAVATATLVAAGASDFEHVTAHHRKAKHHAAPPARVVPASAPAATVPRAHDVGPQPITSSSRPAESSRPAAGKDGKPAAPGAPASEGAPTAKPAPSVPKGTTDEPGSQPIKGAEPVESQGFTAPAAGGSPTPGAGESAPPASGDAAPVDPSNSYSEPAP
ncbi:MAG: sigma-70 family RNA polymerase sigma factor [Thermoleophilaceae bacterium]